MIVAVVELRRVLAVVLPLDLSNLLDLKVFNFEKIPVSSCASPLTLSL